MCIRDSFLRLASWSDLCFWRLRRFLRLVRPSPCLLYTSDAADDLTRVALGGRRFFQAEDGIRDLVRSRGLGDVYKRQLLTFGLMVGSLFLAAPSILAFGATVA